MEAWEACPETLRGTILCSPMHDAYVRNQSLAVLARDPDRIKQFWGLMPISPGEVVRVMGHISDSSFSAKEALMDRAFSERVGVSVDLMEQWLRTTFDAHAQAGLDPLPAVVAWMGRMVEHLAHFSTRKTPYTKFQVEEFVGGNALGRILLYQWDHGIQQLRVCSHLIEHIHDHARAVGVKQPTDKSGYLGGLIKQVVGHLIRKASTTQTDPLPTIHHTVRTLRAWAPEVFSAMEVEAWADVVNITEAAAGGLASEQVGYSLGVLDALYVDHWPDVGALRALGTQLGGRLGVFKSDKDRPHMRLSMTATPEAAYNVLMELCAQHAPTAPVLRRWRAHLDRVVLTDTVAPPAHERLRSRM